MDIKFNPDKIKAYRLIGYDNKKSTLAENSDELEGGEIGSGTGNTVLFEIVPYTLDSLKSENVDIANVSVLYHLPADTLSRILKFTCPKNYVPFSRVDKCLQFATAVAMFGLKLKESQYFPDVSWDAIKNIALASSTPGDYLQTEFVGLIDKCKVIYYEKRRKKRKN